MKRFVMWLLAPAVVFVGLAFFQADQADAHWRRARFYYRAPYATYYAPPYYRPRVGVYVAPPAVRVRVYRPPVVVPAPVVPPPPVFWW